MTRNSRRVLLLAGIFGLSLLSCGREVTGPGDGLPFGLSRVAALAIDPRFPQLPGTNFASDLVPFVRVRVTLRGLDGAVVKDTLVDFPSNADSVALTLDVPLPLTVSDSGLPLTLAMAFVDAAGDTVFRGGPAAIRARPSGSTTNAPIVIPVAWVPPGAVPASVVMTPTTGTGVAGTTAVFSATAFDGGGAPIPGTPIDFSADTSSRASFAAPGSGTVTWLPNRGNVRIIASTLNLRADTSFFVVSLPASRLLAVSGGAQSAVIGTALVQPLVFRVTASDSVPVAGIPVAFAVTAGGGSLVAVADTSDATGLVSTSWTLGSVVGAQSVTATATGIAGATQVVAATGLAPLPTQLAITAAPTTGVAGATLTPVIVEVRDANNVLTPLFTGPVTLALNAGATGATLGGTATVNAVAGIATFSDLSIQRAAAGLTLSATSGALTPDTSAAFAITPAAPATLVALAGDAQTGTLGQPLADSLAVELRDAFANPISGATIVFSVTTGGGNITPATGATDANGRARASWTLGALVGTQAARAQLDGAPTIFREFTATGAPGTPVRLEIVGEPAATQVAGAPFAPAMVVRAVDAVGATVTAFTGTIDLALAVNPSATTPTGTLSAAAVAGVATFSNVVITATGVGYTLAATSGALLPDTTIAITVLNAAAAQLTLVSGNAQSGAVITALAAPFVVRVTDSFGNGVSGFAVDWAITSTGGALSATTTATDAGGFASTTLTLPSVAGTATVQATAGGLTGSPQLFTATATAGTASQLAFTFNTGAGIAGAPITPGFVIEARDGLGNVVPGFTGAITVALTNGPPTAVLGGTATVNAVAGVATFADLTVDLAASSWVLAATSPGLAGANSAAFSIGAAAPAQITVLSGDAQTAAVLAALADSIAFRVADQFGNIAAGAPVTVAITVGDGSVSPVGGVTDASGRFATAWTLGTLLGAQSITATITTAPTAQAVATAAATPGAAVALALVNTLGPQVSGATIPDFVVEARDAIGNVATAFNGVVNGRVLTGPNGPDTDSVSVTAVNGVATFSGLTFETAGDYTLRFNAVGLADVIHPTITVSPGAAANIAVVAGDAQTGAVSATLPDSITFRVTDAFGNGVPGTLLGIAVTTGGGALAPLSGNTDANGELRTAWTLGPPLGPQSITATVAATPALQAVASATGVAGAATQLVLIGAIGPQVAGVVVPDVVVEARDAGGNVAIVFNGIVGAYVIDSTAATVDSAAAIAVAGVATFSGAIFETSGAYTIRFFAPGLTDAVSGAFVVSPSAAAIVSPDSVSSGDGQSATVGQPLALPLRAFVTDNFGNPIGGVAVVFTGVRGADTLSVDTLSTSAQGQVALTPTMPAIPGLVSYVVTSNGLIGSGFTLNASATAGAATQLAVTAQPSAGTISGIAIPAMTVVAQDALGNLVTAFTGPIEAVVDSGPALGWSLGGTQSINAVLGAATFSDLTLDRASDYRLRFRTPGLDSTTTIVFTVTAGAQAALSVAEGDGQTGGATQTLPDSIGARVTDAFGNPIAGATVVWTVQAGGGSLAVASGSTNAAGIARNAWTLGANIGTQSVSADAAGLSQVIFTATATATLANISWTGATSANWSVASNWSGGVVPTVSDSVRIPAGTPFAAALDAQALVVGRLLIENGATVVLDTFPLFVNGTLDVEAGAAVLSDSLGGFALIGTGAVRGAMPRLYVQGGAHTLNGPLALAGDLSISGGSFDVGTFATTVGGGLSTIGTGQLVMTSAPGSITVQGDAIFAGGSTAGALTAGVLTVRGDFLQGGGAADAFSASGTHVVDLDGSVTQVVTLLNADTSFTGSCGTGSCFATLRSFKGAGAGAIEFNSNAKATTLMQFTNDSVYAPGQTLISAGTPDFPSAVTVAGAIGWQTALTRGATFQVDTLIAWGTAGTLIAGETIPTRVLGEYQLVAAHPGAIVVDGANGVLDVAGTVSVGSGSGPALVTRGNGRVRMAQAADTLAVLGDADFGGGSTAGQLTAGLLELRGAFTQAGDAESFAASGAHQTWFRGTSAQNVTFTSAGTGVGASHFAAFGVGQPALGIAVQLNTPAFADGMLLTESALSRRISSPSAQQLTTQGATVTGLVFERARWALVDGGPVTAIDSVRFETQDAGLVQFDLRRNGGTIGLGVPTFSTTPTTGRYLRVEDIDGPTANGALTVNLTTPTPATSGGFLEVVNGAVVNGWTADAGFTWTGATDSNWLTASNWSDGVVPTGADSVHIPTGLATYPVIAADTAIRVLTMDAGATLDHSGANVAVRGSVVMAPTAAVTASSGVVQLTGPGAQTVRGSFYRLYLDGGDYALTGPVVTADNVEVYNGDLSVGNFDFTIGGGFLTGIGGTMTMTGTGTVDVATYVNFFGNSTAGRLTNGILRVRGDFDQLTGGGQEDLSFSASGNHVVELAGTGRQRVRFDSPDTTINGSCATSCFATLRSVQAPGTGWVEFGNGVKVLGDLDLQADSVVALGTPAVGVRLVVAGTARFDTPVLRAGLIAWRDSLAQNASTALEVDSLVAWGSDTLLVGMPGVRTVVTGSYRLRGTIESSVDVQGALQIQGASRVLGDFSTSAGGTIAMSLLGDTLAVDSTATFGGGSTAGLLTGGTVRVGGNFFATSSAAYAAGGAHRTVLYDGCAICDGYFVGLSDTLSTFRDLEIESGAWTVNPPSSEVHISDNLSLLGTAQLDGTPLVRVGNSVNGDLGTNLASIRLSVAGAFDFAGTYLVDTLILAGASHVLTGVDPLGNSRNYNNVRVTGTATVVDDAINGAQVLARLIVDGGTLRVGTVLSTDSARVFVNGVLETINGGVLEMRTPLGRLGTGNANFGGGSTAGLLTAGLLSINGGDFTQTGDPASFSASGTHETRFSNEGQQQVTFANPGSTGATSRFQHLRISQTEGSGLELLSDVVAGGQLRETMSAPAIVTAPIGTPFAITTGGANVTGIEFTRVRWVLGDGAPADTTIAIRFNDMPDDVIQFDIIRGGGTVALQTLDFLTTPSTGLYLRAEDGDVGNAIPFVVAVTSPTPTTHGGAIAEVAGATIIGWPQDPPLILNWLGLLSSDFTNPANWVEGLAPDATAEVTIGSGGNFGAAISSPQTVRRLTVSPGSTLFLNPGDTLTVTGDVDVSGTIIAGALDDSTVVLRMAPTAPVNLRATGEIGGRLVIEGGASGVVQLVDSVRVTGNFRTGVNVLSGLLDLNGQRLDVLGEFRTLQTGRLEMDAIADTLFVGENIIFGGGSTDGQLTDGVIVANSWLTQRNTTSSAAFTATGNHTVRFVGNLYDSQVEFDSPGAALSRFANVALEKIGGRSVNFFNTSTFIRDLISIENPVFVNSGALTVTGSVVQPGPGSTFDVDATASVNLSGVNGATCDGFLFTVANTPANFTPIACWQPPLQGIVWTGATSTQWSDAGNWDLGRLPIATDSVSIDGSVTAGAGNPYTVSMNVSSTVAKLIVGPSASLTLNHTFGQTLTVDSLSAMPAGTTLNITSGSVLAGAGDVNLGGFLNWNGGTLSGTGTMYVQAGGSADIATSGAVTLNGRQVRVGGDASLGGAGFAAVGTPTIEVEATGTLGFTATTSYFSGNGLVNLVNDGTLRKAASAGLVRVDWPITNTGTIEIVDDSLDLRNSLTHVGGTVSILANAALVNGGNTVASAPITIAAGGVMTLQSGGISADAGNHIFGPTSSVSGLGRLRINSADTTRIQGGLDIDSLTVQNGNTWFESADTMFVTRGAYLGGGFFRGSGVLGIRGDFVLNAGNIVGTGTFSVRPTTGNLTLRGMNGWTVDVEGTATWGDYDMTFGQDTLNGIPYASMRVRSGGVFDIQHGITTPRELFALGSATPPNVVFTVDAGGTIRKTAGSGVSNLRPRVLMSGNFNALSGTINVQGTCVMSGTKSGPGSVTGQCGTF